MLSTLLLCVLSTSHAQGPAPGAEPLSAPEGPLEEDLDLEPSGDSWPDLPPATARTVLDNSRVLTHIGWALDAGGLVAGVASDNAGAAMISGVANTGGHVMVMSGQMRQARALNSLGYDVSRAPGWTAWSMWVAGEVVATVGAANGDEGTYLLGGLLAVGSYVPMFIQGARLNRISKGTASQGGGAHPGMALGLTPAVAADHGGLAVVGRF